jgi:hypothetical protein
MVTEAIDRVLGPAAGAVSANEPGTLHPGPVHDLDSRDTAGDDTHADR